MSNSSHSILLTGGAGLIGNAVLRELNRQGHTDVLVVDKLGMSPTKWKNLCDCQFADFIEYDDFAANDYRKGFRTMDGVKTVIHLGAKSATTEQDMAFLSRNNFGFSQWLAIWANSYGARYVYASSAATYGAGSMKDKDDLAYLSSLRPLNPYGYSKSLFDVWIARQGWLSGDNAAVGLKYFNVFGGPSERHKGDQRSLLVKAYDALAAGKPIELFESANPEIPTAQIRRDFLSAEDAAKVTVWAAVGDGSNARGLFNVGSGQASSFAELATWVATAYSTANPDTHIEDAIPEDVGELEYFGPASVPFPWITYVPMPAALRSRYQYHSLADVTKLRAAGYTEEFTPLKAAVEQYVTWMAKEGGV